MKRNKWLGIVAAVVVPLFTSGAQTPADAPPPPAAAAPALSANAAEVVRLAEAGTSDEVVLAYVQNSTATFDLSADQILYLRDIGVSSPVITAMLTRDNTLHGQAPAYTYDQKLYPATAPPPPAAEAPVQPQQPEPVPTPAPSVAAAPPPVYVSSPPAEVGYFYNDLSPYGTWVQLDGVGWCWQPRVLVINHGWRPYCDSGHWVYTDAGWFWQSDYSWGWAPFHYGRWYMHDRCGWVWTPDRVWGPAWVTWRSEGDHCGWAPLPPHADFDLHLGFLFNGVHVAANFDFGLRPDHFTFIAMNDFHNHDFAHHRLPPTEVTRIYNHTTIINNYVVNNNTIVNQGIKVDRVAAATHTQVHKIAIRDVPTSASVATASRGGAKGDLVVYRPQLKAPEKPVHMVAQKVDDRHPVIQHPAVVPARTERPLIAGNSGAAGRGSVGSSPTTWQRPTTQRTTVNPPSQSTTKTYRPTTTGSSAPSPASTPRANEQAKTAPLTPTPSPRYEQERPQPARPPAATTQPQAKSQYPLRSATPTYSEPARPNAPAQNSGTYYPKSYHQASEAHALPPINAHGSDSRPQPSLNSRPQNPPDNTGRGQGGPGQKNEK
jgi:hypothetical protein